MCDLDTWTSDDSDGHLPIPTRPVHDHYSEEPTAWFSFTPRDHDESKEYSKFNSSSDSIRMSI